VFSFRRELIDELWERESFEVLCYKPEGREFESDEVRRADSPTVICEPIVYTMWNP
jgi:hypothetical protein